MPGFSAKYSHQAGDRFVFKGGVIWPSAALPLEIVGSGASGTPDTYTTDHSWYSGGSWSRPVFDGGGIGAQLLKATSKGFVTINDLTLKNMDVAGSDHHGYALHFVNCHDLTLTNNRLQPFCWRGIYVVGYDGKTQNNIVIQNNDISDVDVAVTVATDAANTVINNVDISGNHIHDFTSMIVNAVHADGIQMWTSNWLGTTESVNGSIYNNTFSGSVVRSSLTGTAGMTAWIYLDHNNGNFVVHNNVLSYTDTPSKANLFEALISVRQNSMGSSQIYNNTLNGTYPGMSAALLVDRAQNVTFNNNIVRGMLFCFYLASAKGFTSDYNVLNSKSGVKSVGSVEGAWKTFAQWQGMGNDTHGSVGDPLFVSPPDDLHLQAGSPAIGSATTLSRLFATDRDGKTRAAPWDIGAYVAPSAKTK